MTKNEKLDMRKAHLLAAAAKLTDLMYEWNVVDEYDLCIENSYTGTPYHHVTTALRKVLLLLGVKNSDSGMDFYEMYTTGMNPAEALERIMDNERDREGN